MDLRQLTALVTVADVGSVTRAAQLLHLVQPAVSRQIRSLEEELGVALFERTRRGMLVTEDGEVMVDRARRALQELERAKAELRPSPGEVTGIVSVGLLESVAELIAQPLADTIRRRYPALRLRILTGYSGYLKEWLETGDLDLALLYLPGESPSFITAPLLAERLWAVAPPEAGLELDHPVSWEQLLTHSLVLPVAGHGLRILIDRARSLIDVRLEISVETNSMHLQKEMVRNGHGWTVLPAAGAAVDVAAGIFSGAPLTEPESTRSIVLGTAMAVRRQAPVEVVATEITLLVRSLVASGGWPAAALPS